MRLGKKLCKEYEAYFNAHPMEPPPEAEYARFIYGLPHGMSCSAAFHYKDVYDILEKAHKDGKKVVLKMPNLEPVSSSTNGIIVSVPAVDITDIMENEDDWDSSLVLATE